MYRDEIMHTNTFTNNKVVGEKVNTTKFHGHCCNVSAFTET